MEIKGQRRLEAPPAAVWAALVDPAFLARLIPGCETMTGSPETGYDITVARHVGGLEARMRGRFDLTEVEAGRGCVLVGGGEAPGIGGATGRARIALAPDGGGTRLTWDIGAALDGRLAVIPDLVVGMAARKVADGFVERFAAAIEGREPEAPKGWLGRLRGR